MMSKERSIHARETYAPPHKVLTNDDLLTEILIRLPILCIYLFTCFLKQWLTILTSHVFTLKRSQIRNLDPLAGLFVNHIRSSFHCDFVSLDPRIKSREYTIDKSFTLGSTDAVDNVNILQSCNGLLLCIDYAHDDSNFYGCAGLRLTFDPTTSPYYKVVRAGSNSSEIVIQIYSSETVNWSLQLTHYKLNIKDHEHPIITTIQIPQGLQQGRNFFESYVNTLPMIITIQIPHMLHLQGKLFESRGGLLLVRRDYIGSSEFTIYEMRIGCSVWSIKYLVDTDDFMSPLPEGWSIRKVVEYNLISKTMREIYDMGSNQVADDYLDDFIPPFAMYDMGSKKVEHKVYEFIPSSASV
ncbi:hypothetical protein Tco_1386270 [Tanacetum coccineum]